MRRRIASLTILLLAFPAPVMAAWADLGECGDRSEWLCQLETMVYCAVLLAAMAWIHLPFWAQLALPTLVLTVAAPILRRRLRKARRRAAPAPAKWYHV